MNGAIFKGVASTGKGTLKVHLWQYDRAFNFYVNLCCTQTSKGVHTVDGAVTCKMCQRIQTKLGMT